MDFRKTPLVTGEYYHIFNRGAARLPTFIDKRDYQQATNLISYYNRVSPPMKFSRFKELPIIERDRIINGAGNKSPLVEIISYVFMPNHFHFELKQAFENGISKFLSKFTNSYTKYFNTKHNRAGGLFQGSFKSVHIETQSQLVHLSRYIHLNPLTSFIVDEKNFLSYPWTSLNDYLKGSSAFLNPKPVLSEFSSIEK